MDAGTMSIFQTIGGAEMLNSATKRIIMIIIQTEFKKNNSDCRIVI